MMRYSLVIAGLLTAAAYTFAAAQEAVLAQLYGQGVHAYFAQDFVKAHELLSSAIDRGTNDPRVYYFRGLALQRLGRPEDAAADFSAGADREAKDLNKFYNVSKALERVQGNDRVALERHRVDARVAAMEEAQRVMQARYEQRREAERHVLAAPPETVKPNEIKPVKPIDTSTNDPFGAPAPGASEPAAPPQEPAVTPKPAEKPAENDPFGMPAAGGGTTTSSGAKPKGGILRAFQRAASKAIGGDQDAAGAAPQPTPFGPLPQPEAGSMPGEPAMAPGAAPGAAPGGNAADPFGAAEKPAAPPAAMPAPAADNPFGAPAAPAGDGQMGAPAADNPFAPEKPADEKPAADAPKPPQSSKPADPDDPFAN